MGGEVKGVVLRKGLQNYLDFRTIPLMGRATLNGVFWGGCYNLKKKNGIDDVIYKAEVESQT